MVSQGARPLESCRTRRSPAIAEHPVAGRKEKNVVPSQLWDVFGGHDMRFPAPCPKAQEAALAALKLEIAEASSTLEATVRLPRIEVWDKGTL